MFREPDNMQTEYLNSFMNEENTSTNIKAVTIISAT